MHLRVVLATAVLFTAIASGRHSLTSDQQQTVDEWIAKNPEFRPALDGDCDCAKSLNDVRTGAGAGDRPVPDYAPYRVTGDFNKDGFEDFAAAVLRKANPTTGFALLIFNGNAGTQFTLAYESRGQDFRGQGFSSALPKEMSS